MKRSDRRPRNRNIQANKIKPTEASATPENVKAPVASPRRQLTSNIVIRKELAQSVSN